MIAKWFQINERGSTVRTELLGGLTTFVTMAYIVVVNPAILAFAGIPVGPSTVATILTAVFGSLLMGLLANRPIAVAPYMGENAFIAFGLAALGIGWQQRLGAVFVSGVVFLVITLFPLGIGAQPHLLQSIAPGIIWVSALLAAMLSLDSLFRSDFDDGSLEQILLSAHPASLSVLAKVIAHWLVTGFPLLIVAPLLAVFLGMPTSSLGVLLLTLLLGTPVLSLIGAIGVALTVGLRRGGMILSLLVLPLYVPVLIFASNAVEMAGAGLPIQAQLNILISFLIMAVFLAPWPTAAALKMSIN